MISDSRIPEDKLSVALLGLVEVLCVFPEAEVYVILYYLYILT